MEPSTSFLAEIPETATLTIPNDTMQIPYLILNSKNSTSVTETARIPIHTSSCTTSNNHQALFIGRQVTSCDIRIDHGSISRKHAALYFIPLHTSTTTEYHLMIQDLGTKHGLTINHTRIPSQKSIVLYQGDEIQFGKIYEQVFVVGGWVSRPRLDKEEEEDPIQQPSPLVTTEAVEVEMVIHPILSRQNTNIENQKYTQYRKLDEEKQQEEQEQEEPYMKSRAQREAEIQAMIQSLEQTPIYKKMKSFPSHDENDSRDEDQDEEDSDDHIEYPFINQPNHKSSSTTSAQTLHQLSSLFMNDQQISSLVNKYQLPISCTVCLPRNPISSSTSSSDMITALHGDITGARLLTGTSHGYLHLYDFSGMTLSHPYPFKSVLIEEGQYPIHDAAFSVRSGGDRIFVGTGSPQPTLLDREGKAMIQCTKGDPYVIDTAKNAGHTGCVTSVAWHPLGDSSNTACCNIVLSSSGDSSVRIWDVERNKVIFDKLTSRGEDVLRVKNEKGQRIAIGGGVTCATFSPNGREIAVGTACGSIQIWKYAGGPYTRPIRAVYHAHKTNINSASTSSSSSPAIHSLVYSPNGTILASRSMDDDTIRIWNAQFLSRQSIPHQICIGDLLCNNEFTNCAFRPDGTLLCAGTSVESRTRNEQTTRRPTSYGCLKFYSLEAPIRSGGIPKTSTVSSPVLDLPIVEGVSIGKVLWHAKLNQIFVSLSDGSVQILFDPVLSSKGALLCTAKGLRVKDDLSILLEKRAQSSSEVQGEIIAPNDPSYRQKLLKRKRERADRKDPVKSKHPEPPAEGIKSSESSGGALNLVQFLATESAPVRNVRKDPREELFKYLEGKNYAQTLYDGDRKILADKTVEEEEEEERKRGRM